MGGDRNRGVGRLGLAAGVGLGVGVVVALVVYFFGLNGRTGNPIMHNLPVALAAAFFVGGATAWGVHRAGWGFFTDPDR